MDELIVGKTIAESAQKYGIGKHREHKWYNPCTEL